jgi:hypothetical protein
VRLAADVRERPMTLRLPWRRRSLLETFRETNRLPFAMGLLGLVSAALLIAGLTLGGWRWAYALEALGALILGALLIGAYYRGGTWVGAGEDRNATRTGPSRRCLGRLVTNPSGSALRQPSRPPRPGKQPDPSAASRSHVANLSPDAPHFPAS